MLFLAGRRSQFTAFQVWALVYIAEPVLGIMPEQVPHFISLGAGVQSSCMFLMACHEELTPRPRCAIFADTGDEPAGVYTWIEKVLKPAGEKYGIPVIVARHNSGKTLAQEASRVRQSKNGPLYTKPSLPFFTLRPDLEHPGQFLKALIPRQCTQEFKIEVCHRAIKQFLGIKRAYKGLKIHQWMGISIDEAIRRKDARKPWLHNEYPLMDQVQFNRQMCQKWLVEHGYPMAPRSACIYCPYHSDAQWMQLKTQDPEAFKLAAEWEKKFQEIQAIPKMNMKGKPFLHRSCVPLEEVVFAKNEENGFNNECEGHCGI